MEFPSMDQRYLMPPRDQTVAGDGGILLRPCAEKAGIDVAYMHAGRNR
jgi:hypothetical protein